MKISLMYVVIILLILWLIMSKSPYMDQPAQEAQATLDARLQKQFNFGKLAKYAAGCSYCSGYKTPCQCSGPGPCSCYDTPCPMCGK